MDFTNPIAVWAALGLFLMFAELVIPGGIVFFLGAAGIVVATGLQFGLIEGWIEALTTWFVSSLILLMSFRNVMQKMVGGETTLGNTNEEMDIYGKIARVVEPIGPGEDLGRIEFQGTTWPAKSDGSEIPVGESVKIISHQNISVLVERLSEAELFESQHR